MYQHAKSLTGGQAAFHAGDTRTRANPIPTGPVATYFQRPCPACARRLLIPVKHLRKDVFCGHCRHGFVAREVLQDRRGTAEGDGSILERAERLLAALEPASRNRQMCEA